MREAGRFDPAAGLIFLDSRSPIGVEDKLHGNDNNGCFLTFYEVTDLGGMIKYLRKQNGKYHFEGVPDPSLPV